MKKKVPLIALLFIIFSALTACAKPIPVELVESHGQYTLLRDGKPYFIKGTGGSKDMELLNRTGANSIRTWGDTDTEFLDKAHALGFSVCVGLWVDHERHGFDYSDDKVVAAQIERHRRTIDRLKDHPAVLMWGIGNEVELEAENSRVWEVVEAIASYAKEVDPHHPTMTVIAQAPKYVIKDIIKKCPSIDILGTNSYGGIGIVAREIYKAGWTGPYIITEWGNDGNWETAKTDWGAEIEPTSTEKAAQRSARYNLIAGDRERCLGSYAFFWGWKQETTPTWFNLFTEDGRQTESVELLQYVWTGSFPKALAPRIANLTMNGVSPSTSLRVKPGEKMEANFQLIRGELAEVKVDWDLIPESTDKGIGGDPEDKPDPVHFDGDKRSPTHLDLVAPEESGAYRLYLYVGGEGNTVATANFPFYVE